MQDEVFALYDRAVAGDKGALETLLLTVREMIFNLSLRMLGSPQDAEDASQEICIRIITGLSTFKKESSFSTWAYRIAANHLLNYKKSMFSKLPPLTFDFYGADIENGGVQASPGATQGVDEDILAEELKLSCTNVMLQCFDAETRLVYVLGTMFGIGSRVASEILGITPEAYRQRLSRSRQKMAGFLRQYCGLAASPKCDCKRRVGYAIQAHRLDPSQLPYSALASSDDPSIRETKQAMEDMDAQSAIFASLPKYASPEAVRAFLHGVIHSDSMATIQKKQA